MSYLNPLRLHFAGQFQANVSTVNNDSAHFNNAAFQPSYQDMQGQGMEPPNGWFNPQGDAAFRLLGCVVTSAWTQAGQVGSDPVLECIVADSDQAVPAKLVDLDPEQQLVSEIWGLQVRIADAAGNTLMRGRFEPAAFIDIWDRATGSGGGGDIGAGATWQSVLLDLSWGDVSGSPFLAALQQAAAGGTLSIKFNLDGLNMTFTSPDFMCGRIVGTIGPAAPGEPQHLVLGRQFMAVAAAGGNFFKPQGGINFFPAVVDEATSAIYLDLGNALTTASPGGPLNDLGDLTLSVLDPIATPGNPAGTAVPLGTIPSGANGYDQASWYEQTAGVVALPLTADQLALVSQSPLMLTGNSGIGITEAPSGAFLRADRFVYRLSPGDQIDIPVYATQWGRPLSGAAVSFTLDPSQLQPTPDQFPFVGASPPVGVPADALGFAGSTTTGPDGVAILSVTGGDPGNARLFGGSYGIDGQVYGIRPAFADPNLDDGPVNQWNFVSFLLWSGFTAGNPVTWTDVQPVFEQYGNLYPVMLRFLDMRDYDQVVANADLLELAFGLDASDANSMPVTRDLSPAKREAILAFLGDPKPGVAPAAAALVGAESQVGVTTPGALAAQGGKAAAAARRLVLQTR